MNPNLMTPDEQASFSAEVANMLCAKIMIQCGLYHEHISQREANNIYSKAMVDTWLLTGCLEKVKRGGGNSKVYFSRAHLELLKRLEAKKKLRK